MRSSQAGDAQRQSQGGSQTGSPNGAACRWRRAAAFLVAWLLAIGGLSGALGQGLAAPAASEATEPPPLPHVRGPSSWTYQSNLGPARVSLDERRPELVVAAPLEVGHQWSVTWEGVDPARLDRSPVRGRLDGTVEALEPVEVPAGHFVAYRIRLRRTDDQGSRTDTIIWLDPHLGVVKADGEVLWPGAVGAVQRLLGLTALRVELTEARLHEARPERAPPLPEATAAP